MKECAFCSSTAKLSAEHIISEWMENLFPGKNAMKFADSRGNVRKWTSEKINWKARVVCEACNNGWMSDIESGHAKPTLTPLIKGETGIPIDIQKARSIALFAFKTAVVVDHAHHRNKPWFSQRLRHSFGRNQLISDTVEMWIGGIARHKKTINLESSYFSGEITPGHRAHSYVCTFAIGCFVFQVHSANQIGNLKLYPYDRYDDHCIPIWPGLLENALWPLPLTLQGTSDFQSFHRRWKFITLDPPRIRLRSPYS
jgi:hypothetical protein